MDFNGMISSNDARIIMNLVNSENAAGSGKTPGAVGVNVANQPGQTGNSDSSQISNVRPVISDKDVKGATPIQLP
jgi:hypothetical protein